MNDQNEINDDVLAGEYVLGTLQDDERAQFEKRMQSDSTLSHKVAVWEKRLEPMLHSAQPVPPPAAVWDAIEDKITPRNRTEPSGFWYSLVFWRNFSLASAVLLVALSMRIFLPAQELVSAERMMVVLNDQSRAGWVIAANQKASFQVQAIQPTALPQGQVCQLWMQTPDNQIISLGTLPHFGVTTFKSPMTIPSNAKYKVSIETLDQLPVDKPSGEIVFEGELISI